jgi:hypothetical protein
MARSLQAAKMRIGKRCTIDLTVSASQEVERIQELFDLSVADVFRFSLKLLSEYATAAESGKKMAVIDPEKPESIDTIVLPVFPKRVPD